jgi:CheY-like chemotaxis protein
MPNRILVVDDHAPTCELISEVLRAADMEVCSLTNSAAAAAQLQEQKFDAVFLDVRMPAPDGIELARQMRSVGLNRRTVIVMITAEGNQRFLARAFEAGANFVLFKPVDRQALLRLLRTTQGTIDHERRRFTRVNVRCRVTMEVGQERVQGITIDLSANGMQVRSGRRFAVGSVVRLEVELGKGAPPLSAVARVVRLVNEDSMGLELQNLTASGSERFAEFLLPHILQLDRNGFS